MDGGTLTPFALFIEAGGPACRVKVQLRWGDGLYEGVADGPDGPGQRLRLAAAAALKAVAEFSGGAVPLELEDVGHAAAGPHGVVVATLLVRGPHGDQRFVGSAVVRRDPLEAAVQAVLDALGPWPGRGPPAATS